MCSPPCREKVYGIDLSEHLVEMARQRLGERAEIRLGSAEALPYEDNRFDAVFCTEVLEHTLEPRTAVVPVRLPWWPMFLK